MPTAPYPVPPPAHTPSTPPPSRRGAIEKYLTADRWFRHFEQSAGCYITLDVPVSRDQDVVSLADRLTDLAGDCRGQLTLDVSILDEFSTAWLRTLSDLTTLCNQLGVDLRLEGMCPKAKDTLHTTRRLHNAGVGRRYDHRAVPGTIAPASRVGPPTANSPTHAPPRTRFGVT